MKKNTRWLALFSVSVFFAIPACGPKSGLQDSAGEGRPGVAGQSPAAVTETKALVLKHSEPIAGTSPALDNYFTGSHPSSLIANGSFTQWVEGQAFPEGWGGVLFDPKPSRSVDIYKFDNQSLKLEGSGEKRAFLRPATAPDIAELRGKTVVFGGWVYTPAPENVEIQIVLNDWTKYFSNSPSKTDEWELVTVEAPIPEDCANARFVVSIKPSDPAATCFIDGVALIVKP